MRKPKLPNVSLSKSRVMRGLQCEKNLFLSVHHPELEPTVSDSQQALFDQGHEVGARAQKEFPGGVLVDAPYYETDAAVEQTRAAIERNASTIYEATFSAGGVTARIDILHRESSTSPWQLIEVKSSTSAKQEHLDDVAIQLHVAEGAGLTIGSAYVMHINNQATAPDLKNLFARVDVTEDVRLRLEQIQKKIGELKRVLSLNDAPKIEIGAHCSDPYDCPFQDHCWKHVPESSIFDIPGIGKKAWKLYSAGIVSISDSKFVPSSAIQRNRVEAVRTGVRWIDKSAIKDQISEWRWPLTYLDFETIAFAIPRYDGTRPYQQVPFQFSALRQQMIGGPLEETFYLHDDSSDPRPPLIKALIGAAEGPGSVVAYNMSFEATCIRALISAFPDYTGELVSIVDRLVDPLPIFRSSVYDKEFSGSFSIKSVAPAILGSSSSYEGMAVADGEAAQRAFLELIKAKHGSPDHQQLRTGMLAYCRKDTTEMAELVKWLLDVGVTSNKRMGKKRA